MKAVNKALLTAKLGAILGLTSLGANAEQVTFINLTEALSTAGVQDVTENGQTDIKAGDIIDVSTAASLDGLTVRVIGPSKIADDRIEIQILNSTDGGFRQLSPEDVVDIDISVREMQLSVPGMLQSDN